MNLIAINGKLHRDGLPYPLEFGNVEQIKFIQSATKREESLKKGFEPEVDYEEETKCTASFKYTCICGIKRQVTKESESSFDLEILERHTDKCQCGRVYTTSINEHDELILKLK